MRKKLQAQLSSTGEQLRKAKANLDHALTEPALFTAELVTAAQNRVIELQHRYTALRDSYNVIIY